MRGGAVLLVRGAEADVAVAVDERRAVGLLRIRLQGALEDAADLVQVVRVLDRQHAPSVGPEAHRHVVGEGERGGPVEADPVVVVDADQPAQPQEAGERGGLVREALHQVAVRAHEPGPVVDHLVARAVVAGGEHPLRQREPHRVGEALTQRPGRDLESSPLLARGPRVGQQAHRNLQGRRAAVAILRGREPVPVPAAESSRPARRRSGAGLLSKGVLRRTPLNPRSLRRSEFGSARSCC